MGEDFDQPFTPFTSDQARDFQELDEAISRLSQRRVAKLELDGTLAGAALAGRISVYQQTVLWHVLMTARGVRLCWNARNVLACFLLTRSLTETIALFDAFERRLWELFEQGDIDGMEALVLKLTLPGNDLKPEIDDGTRARIIMGAIHELERRHQLLVRDDYVRLVEHCDPHLVAQFSLHKTVDQPNRSVTFSETKDLTANSDRLLLAASLLLVFERSLNVLDDIIQQTP